MRLSETAAFSVSAARLRSVDDEVRELLALYGLSFDDVRDWSLNAAESAYRVRDDPVAHAGRFCGAVGAAIVLGIELARFGEAKAPGTEPPGE